MKTEVRDGDIEEMLEDGHSYSTIQNELGVSPNRIAKVKKGMAADLSDTDDEFEEVLLDSDDENIKEETGHYLYVSASTFENPIFGVLPKKIHEYELAPTIDKFGNRLNGELKKILASLDSYVDLAEAEHILSVCTQGKERFIDFGIEYENSLHIDVLNKIEDAILKALKTKNASVKYPKDSAVKFVTQFLELVTEEVVDFERVSEFLENLQNSIENQQLRKSSKYAIQIRWIQDYLVKKLNDFLENETEDVEPEVYLSIMGSDIFDEFENVGLISLNFGDRLRKLVLSATKSGLTYTV